MACYLTAGVASGSMQGGRGPVEGVVWRHCQALEKAGGNGELLPYYMKPPGPHVPDGRVTPTGSNAPLLGGAG